MSRTRKLLLLAGSMLALGTAGTALTDEALVKKTLDGRCLTPEHKDYWETKVYVAKPSMAECIKSGGKPAQ